MNAMVAPLSAEELKRRIVEFSKHASTEISTHDEQLLPELAERLPAGTTVYVAHTPKATLADVVRVAIRAQSHGLRASPHIVARRTENERALRDALRELRDGGVSQVLLVAGDLEQPRGNFTSTLDILDSGALIDADIRNVGVAGHPEGHRSVAEAALWAALKHKQEYAQRTGTRMHIVTQFGFNPETVCAWDRHLTEHGISLPVHVGIAGPTPLPRLIKFAMQCGIGASLNTLMKNAGAMGNLLRPTASPDQMLIGIVRGCAAQPSTHLVKPHIYAFGGAMATARYLRAVADGSFELSPDSDRFTMNA